MGDAELSVTTTMTYAREAERPALRCNSVARPTILCAAVADDAFSPESPEIQLDQRGGTGVVIQGERGKLGWVALTNDRVLFTQQKFAASPGTGVLAAAVARGLQKRSEKKAGGPREVFSLTEVRSARFVKRRWPLGDVYEFTLADDTTCGLGKSLLKAWDAQIRRLLTERHSRTVVDDGEECWHVE